MRSKLNSRFFIAQKASSRDKDVPDDPLFLLRRMLVTGRIIATRKAVPRKRITLQHVCRCCVDLTCCQKSSGHVCHTFPALATIQKHSAKRK